ncbi:hypothetical protein EBV26_19125, partial [bacterium]|nr:hypothetical protein [bacterium]
NDIAGANFAFVASGDNNDIASGAINSAIVAGRKHNIGDADYAFVGGGDDNDIGNSGDNSTIGGGKLNKILLSTNATIGGGSTNEIGNGGTASTSTISGGDLNTIAWGQFSTIMGGTSNYITGNYSASVGSGNQLYSAHNSFVAGTSNTVAQSSFAFIGSGQQNGINQSWGSPADYAIIGGGYQNNINSGGVYSAIVNGRTHSIGDADFAFIGGGDDNDIGNANYTFVGGGKNNDIATGATFASIMSGENNVINSTSTYSIILGGKSNGIATTNTYSFIGGGESNTTDVAVDYGTIVSGYSNNVMGDRSTIVGGYDNTINGTTGFIGGGEINSITGNFGSISGGKNNVISTSAAYASIIGGLDNTVAASYGTSAGQSNNITSAGAHGIAIGYSNQVAATKGIAIGNDNDVTGTNGVAIGLRDTAAANAMALGKGANAADDEFRAHYSAGFTLKGQGRSSANGVADPFAVTIVNDDAGGGNGLNIKLNAGAPNNSNDFVRFTNSAGNTVGRIEGQTIASTADNASQLPNSDQYVRELALYNNVIGLAEGAKDDATRGLAIGIAKTVLEGVEVGIDWSDVGSRFACGASPFTLNCTALGGTGIAGAVAKVAKLGQMVADVVDYSATYVDALNGLEDAKKLKRDWACNRYSNQGVTYESGSADYAEWLPKTSMNDKYVASDIVGIKDGKISKNTTDADQCMVISMKPIVLGNTPEQGKEKEYEKVAFMGQVPVKVLGKVELGDYIIPSGKNNGLGIARKPKDLSPFEYRKIVGVAWSAGNSPSGINVINVAVGLNHNSTAQVIEEQSKKIVIIEKELDDAQTEIKGINDALVSILPNYKELRKLETNGTLVELFKGLDYDKPKVVSARKLRNMQSVEGIVAERAANVPDVNVVPLEEVERGYLEARQNFINAGGDPSTDPFYSRMERDPVYKE